MLILIGSNHKSCPIELREKLFFSKKRLKGALLLLRERGVLKGAVILSTCHRVEIYACAEDLKSGIREIEDFISRYHEIDQRIISPYLYIYEEKRAMKHLFSVTSGLDSLILGETQILSQVRFSLSEAESVGFVDEFLRKVFHSAILSVRRIHSETKISEGKVSIGSVAMDFIKQRIGTLSGKNVLIIGVGKVTELILKYLKKEKLNVVFISNRTYNRAKELSCQMGAKAVRFDDLKQFLKDADIVITATASPHFIVKKETLEEIAGGRRQAKSQKLLILDLAIPWDVDPRAGEIEGVDLFGLEDLDTVSKKNREKKIQEAEKAKEIIDIEVERLWSKLTKLEREPALLP